MRVSQYKTPQKLKLVRGGELVRAPAVKQLRQMVTMVPGQVGQFQVSVFL